MAILVFLNGEVQVDSKLINGEVVEKVIAVDGGLDKIPRDLKAEQIIGDLDSVQGNYHEIDVLRFPAKKSKSDFELTLEYLTENYRNKKIIIYGLTGGRVDHQLFNFFVLKDHISYNTYIADTITETIYFIPKEITISGHKGRTFSVFPLTPISVTIKGASYPLKEKECDMYQSLTLSNIIKDQTLHVELHQGMGAVIINKD
ncbi:thiamine diphosphokinase [Alkalicella caledoniensis]|uniref:Thiamine diphosphokinase n=1 Tax=Alkalicella caledoniensis TaxID=2731377 RepID=A0A7G9WCE2_ALKCA|nr:thiamine diphosphokinase [Alkalicella caledoniensis]QNO16354.1 thiamine diphosphokinase [Alkalicella caledoniensis]